MMRKNQRHVEISATDPTRPLAPPGDRKLSIDRRHSLDPLGLTVTRAAEGLGVTRQALSELLNGHTGVSVEMAIRLSKAFGSTPETWLGMQMAYDLWQARGHAGEITVERFVAV